MNASQGKDARRSHRALESRQPANVLSTQMVANTVVGYVSPHGLAKCSCPAIIRVLLRIDVEGKPPFFSNSPTCSSENPMSFRAALSPFASALLAARKARSPTKARHSHWIASRLIRCSVAMSSPLVQVV